MKYQVFFIASFFLLNYQCLKVQFDLQIDYQTQDEQMTVKIDYQDLDQQRDLQQHAENFQHIRSIFLFYDPVMQESKIHNVSLFNGLKIHQNDSNCGGSIYEDKSQQGLGLNILQGDSMQFKKMLSYYQKIQKKRFTIEQLRLSIEDKLPEFLEAEQQIQHLLQSQSGQKLSQISNLLNKAKDYVQAFDYQNELFSYCDYINILQDYEMITKIYKNLDEFKNLEFQDNTNNGQFQASKYTLNESCEEILNGIKELVKDLNREELKTPELKESQYQLIIKRILIIRNPQIHSKFFQFFQKDDQLNMRIALKNILIQIIKIYLYKEFFQIQ